MSFQFREASKGASNKNGLSAYKKALETFRNMGSNANDQLCVILYHGLFTLVSNPKLFQREHISQLMEVEKLHEETFYIFGMASKKIPGAINFEFP